MLTIMRTIYQNCDKLKSYFGSFRNFMDSAQCNSKNIERHGCNEGSTRDGRNKVTAASQSSSKDVKHLGRYLASAHGAGALRNARPARARVAVLVLGQLSGVAGQGWHLCCCRCVMGCSSRNRIACAARLCLPSIRLG